MLNRAQIPASLSFLAQRSALIGSKRSSHFFRPTKTSIALSDKCTRTCANCFASGSPEGANQMSYEIAHKVIAQISGKDYDNLVITGGETSLSPDLLLETVRDANVYRMHGLAIHTNTNMPEDFRTTLFSVLGLLGWDNAFRFFQFNISYHLDRNPEETEMFKDFVREFVANFRHAHLTMEYMLETEPAIFNQELSSRLEEFIRGFDMKTINDQFKFMYSFPLMVGKGRAIRGTKLAEVKRSEYGPINFNVYRRLEDPNHDIIAIDPHGFVYPCGTYMYLGIYPIGHIMHSSLDDMIREAQKDPILKLINDGRGLELYELACKLYPDFNGLLDVLADPCEVIIDLLSDRDKALAIIEAATKIV